MVKTENKMKEKSLNGQNGGYLSDNVAQLGNIIAQMKP
jgi:hypothetical protein